MPDERGILLPFVGKDDPGALDHAIHHVNPAASEYTVPLDTERSKDSDFLAEEPYNSICTAMIEGRFCFLGGGPMCRTVSVLRQIPKEAPAPRVIRGRDDVSFWGLPGNTATEQKQADDDAVLLLRQMYVTSLMYSHCPGPLGSFLEHPADPARHSDIPNAKNNPSIWVLKLTKEYLGFLNTTIDSRSRKIKLLTFAQCRLGQVVAKPTTEASDLDLPWDGMMCNHPDKHSRRSIPGQPKTIQRSSDLGRYPWPMMLAKAHAIMKVWRPKRPMANRDQRQSLLTGSLEKVLTSAKQLSDSKRCCLHGCSSREDTTVGCPTCGMTFHDSPCYEKHRAACSVQSTVPSFDAFSSDGNHEPPEPKAAAKLQDHPLSGKASFMSELKMP